MCGKPGCLMCRSHIALLLPDSLFFFFSHFVSCSKPGVPELKQQVKDGDRRGRFGTCLFWKENGSAFSAPVFRALPADCCKFIAPCWGLAAFLCDRGIQVERRVSFSLEFRISLQQHRLQQQINFPVACSRFSCFTFLHSFHPPPGQFFLMSFPCTDLIEHF